jgi:5-methylthioadenosine/S-adenosylhomocysteine deaminase
MVYDLVIYNGAVLTVNASFDQLACGMVGIVKDRIETVRPFQSGDPLPVSKLLLDAEDGIIMPGLVNTHTHLPMTLFRGFADDLPLMVWLNDHIFPAEAKYIQESTIAGPVQLACAEMMLSGTTTCCDGYFLEDHVAAAVQETGIRAILAQGVIDFPAPGVPNPADNIHAAENFLDQWARRSDTITPSVFCHSPYTCSERTLRAAKQATRRRGVMFQIHVAETETERRKILSDKGMTPVQYLEKIGVLDEKTLLAHCVWLDDTDIRVLADTGATVSHNPGSNMKLAAGIAPIPEFISAGIPVGIGTDGCASNNNLDMFEEMDLTAKIHKARLLDPTRMDAATVIEMATRKGAEAIGMAAEIGSIEPGKLADIIVIDTRKPHLQPRYRPASHVVYAVKGSDVRDVVVGGKIRVRDYRLEGMNLASVMADVNRIAHAIGKGDPPP